MRPGAGFSGAAADAAAVATYAKKAGEQKPVDFILHIIPDSVVGAFAAGDILQVLLFAILFGFSLLILGERGATIRNFIDDTAHAIFGVIAIVMKAAPIGAFGAMAYTIGRFGPQALGNLFGLILVFLHHIGNLRLRRARHHCPNGGVQHLQVHWLSEG